MIRASSSTQRTRPRLRGATYGRLTQGSIFCCAVAGRYPNSNVYGVVITARCDLAQDKYPVLNYLPVIPLRDWLRQDGLDILVENELASINGQVRGELKQANLSERLLDAVTIAEIAEKNFSLGTGDKASNKTAERFRAIVKRVAEFEALIKIGDSDATFLWFVKNKPSEVDAIITRLSKNSVSGYYFLECIDLDDTDPQGYVCLLREVYSIPKAVSDKIAGGLTEEALKLVPGCANVSLNFRHEHLSMPVVEIDSPTIEHLLQSFTQLFGRIGVADPETDVISRIQGLVKLVEGATK